jgi:hypothetical protein
MRYLLIAAIFILVGCSAKEAAKTCDKIASGAKTGQTALNSDTAKNVAAIIPGAEPVRGALAEILGGIAALATSAGVYFKVREVKKNRQNKILRNNMPRENLVTASKLMYGKAYDEKLVGI